MKFVFVILAILGFLAWKVTDSIIIAFTAVFSLLILILIFVAVYKTDDTKK